MLMKDSFHKGKNLHGRGSKTVFLKKATPACSRRHTLYFLDIFVPVRVHLFVSLQLLP